MTKQDAIKNAYGEYWEQLKDYVDKNGFCDAHKTLNIFSSINEKDIDMKGNYWRPKQLQGIENNNGWLSIEFHGLPNKSGEYYCISTFDKEIKTYTYPNEKFTLEVNEKWWNKYITHYQPIIKPQLPIY